MFFVYVLKSQIRSCTLDPKIHGVFLSSTPPCTLLIPNSTEILFPLHLLALHFDLANPAPAKSCAKSCSSDIFILATIEDRFGSFRVCGGLVERKDGEVQAVKVKQDASLQSLPIAITTGLLHEQRDAVVDDDRLADPAIHKSDGSLCRVKLSVSG